jgi:hypothetical protein
MGDQGGAVAEYMQYHGRAVEVYARTPNGKAIPRLHPGDQGEAVGDYAVMNESAVEWNGSDWVPSTWKDLIHARCGTA